jgi:hypothetical protein
MSEEEIEATVRHPEELYPAFLDAWELATKDFAALPSGRTQFESPVRVRVTVEVLED